MITSTKKKEYKAVLGHRYVAPVLKELIAAKEYKNDKKEPYSSSQITNVMNGVPHNIIEGAIKRAVIKKVRANAEIDRLLSKKPVVGATG